MSMERTVALPQKQFLLGAPIYKSNLVYKPNDYYNANRGSKYYYDEDDVESQEDSKEDAKAILASGKKQRRRRSCTLCCCGFCYVLFILLLAAAIVVIKLVPKVPAVSLGDLNIKDFVYTESKDGSQQIQASLSCGLNVTNRNSHADATYTMIDIELFFKNESLGKFNSSPQPQFVQKKKMTTALSEDLPEKTTTITNKSNADSLKSEAASSNVQVSVSGTVKGTLKVLGMKVKKFNVVVMCILNVKPGTGADIISSPTCY